jgi:diketogulonate reductase-like aldo/keto reductase
VQLLEIATVQPHSVEQMHNIATRDQAMIELMKAKNIAYTAYGCVNAEESIWVR